MIVQTLKQTIFISEMLRTAKLVETSTELFDSVPTVPLIEKCGSSHSGSLNYDMKFGAEKQKILAKGTDIEEQIRQGNGMVRATFSFRNSSTF